METFKPIDGWPWYEVSDAGNVRSLLTGKLRKFSKCAHGYLNCMLSIEGGKGKAFYVHRLVAMAFIPNPYRLSDVDHVDGNASNNAVANLRWVSHRDNLRFAVERRGYNWSEGNRYNAVRFTLSDSGREVMSFSCLADAAIYFGKSYPTFAPMVCRAIKRGWKVLGYHWHRA